MTFDTKLLGINITACTSPQLKNTLLMPTDTRRRSTNALDNTPVWYTALRQCARRPSPAT